MVAAVLVMVSCGNKEKELTPEQRAENFAKDMVESIVNGDAGQVKTVIGDMKSYVESLDEAAKKAFGESFEQSMENLGKECTEEQTQKAERFMAENWDLFLDLAEFE